MLLLGALRSLGRVLTRRTRGAAPEEVAPVVASVDRGPCAPRPLREPVVARLVGAPLEAAMPPAEAPLDPGPTPVVRQIERLDRVMELVKHAPPRAAWAQNGTLVRRPLESHAALSLLGERPPPRCERVPNEVQHPLF